MSLEPTRSPEGHRRLISEESSLTDIESKRVASRREPIPASSCAKMRLKLGQRNQASFAAKKKTPDERSFAMDLVVPCASLAHELGEQLDGFMPTERDRAITAQDPKRHDACAEYETANTARTTAAALVTEKQKTSASHRHARLDRALTSSGAAHDHFQLTRRRAMTKIMAGAPYEHSSSEMLMGGQPADIIDDARRRQRPDAVDSDGDDRHDVGDDAQQGPRHRLREELVDQEVERLAGLGVITRCKPCPKKCSPSLFFVPKRSETNRFVSDFRYT